MAELTLNQSQINLQVIVMLAQIKGNTEATMAAVAQLKATQNGTSSSEELNIILGMAKDLGAAALKEIQNYHS